MIITSLTNDKAKYVRSLYRRNVRQGERTFVIEGVRLVEEALDSGANVKLVFYDEDALLNTERGSALYRRLREASFESWAADHKVIDGITETVSPQGVVAAVEFPEWRLTSTASGLMVILDGVQDPGNLGTVMRSAEASGVRALLLTSDSVDLYNPKVVRAAMGAHFRLPVFPDMSWKKIEGLLEGTEQVVLTEASAEKAYYDIDWTKPSALIIGNEAHGPGEDAKRLATVTAAIPMVGKAESLNAGVAASIIMFEALRHRTQRDGQ